MIKIDQLIRSRRKSIGLIINHNAELIVRAPRSVSLSEIQKIIDQKSSWINRKQELSRMRQPLSRKTYTKGEEFLFKGETYRLQVVDDATQSVQLKENLEISRRVFDHARVHVRSWYKRQAADYIFPRTAELAKQLGLVYKSVKINEAKTHWGSCGYQGTLNFTWRLIMAPVRVVDYVIIHELMHIRHRNHSKRFWNDIQLAVPDYKKDERWLKHYSHLTRI